MGRALAYFREHSARLVPPVAKDQYEDETYLMLELKAKQGEQKVRPADLFDE
jgi:hypothetical protein